MYAQYFVKYVQSYQAVGVPVNYISVQNEPNCCQAGNPTAMNYPGMSWNPSGLVEFTKNHVYPAFRAAGITTKVLIHDWNYGDYASFGSGVLDDAAVRNDPLFGGIAWHGYFGDPSVGTQVHNQYPTVQQFSTEHSGGTWIGNQHNEDLADIVNYARNWSGSLVKWSLALNQNMGPHNGGCGTCTGLITVQEGGARAGQVDYTIEYYTTGHLTKFVRPGARPDRLNGQRHGPERRLAQPGRLQGADRPQRRHLGPVGAGQLGQPVLRVHPAGPHHGHLHLVRHARQRRRRRWRHGHQPDRRPGRQVRRRGRRQHRQRHRRAALDLQRHRRPAVDPVGRRHPARARQVPGHRRSQRGQRHLGPPVGLPHRQPRSSGPTTAPPSSS